MSNDHNSFRTSVQRRWQCGGAVIKTRMIFSKNRNLAVVCFSSSFGGLELSTLRLAKEFTSRQANTILIVPRDTPLAAEAIREGLQVVYLRPRIKYGDVLASWELARILSAHQVEIAVVMQSKDINVVVASKFAYPAVKLVYYQQMQSTVDKRDALHTWMYSKLSLWISLTNRMKEEVLKHTRVPERLVKVVPLGRDTHVFDPQRYDQLLVRRRFDLPLDRPIVAMLGRLDHQKGQEEFLRSLRFVADHHPDVLYLIAGDETQGEGGYRRYLVNLANELGFEDRVSFLPFTEDVPEFLAAIDVFVLPSYSETFGLVLIEAMAMEKPVVATSAGGVPEIVENGRDGLLIPPRDEKALADAINMLLDDPSLRISLSRHARQDVLLRFDSRRCVDQLVYSLDSL